MLPMYRNHFAPVYPAGLDSRGKTRPDSKLAALLVFHPTDRFAHQDRGIFEAQLVLDARTVGLNGLDAETQVIGDSPGALALADPAKDLQLPVAQVLDERAFGSGPAGVQPCRGLCRERIADEKLPSRIFRRPSTILPEVSRFMT